MTVDKLSDTKWRLTTADKEIYLLGTAHVSSQSVEEVNNVLEEERPERLCIELDEARFRVLNEDQNWRSLDIKGIIKQKKGFLLLAQLVLSSFQRKIGMASGVKTGDEMRKAVEVAERLDIPFSLCDRDVQVTLRRAWAKSGFWGKNKMLAALLSSAFSNEKVSELDIEALKKRNALDNMMQELSRFLPTVKEVLIDERDRYLATGIFSTAEKKVVAVVGAGHMGGISSWMEKLEKQEVDTDLSALETIPSRSFFSKIFPWLVPLGVAALLVAGFFMKGVDYTLHTFLLWIIVNGSLSALGAVIALAHPLTVLICFVAAPITSLNPLVGVGLFSGLLETSLRKPRVLDFENLHDDILNIKGFYRNRVTRILLVFFLSSLGSVLGTFIALPFLLKVFA